MNVSPICRSQLPRAVAADVAFSRSWARRLARLARERTVVLRGLGEVTVLPVRVIPTVGSGDRVAGTVWMGGQASGFVAGLDRATASTWAATLLGMPSGFVPRPSSPFERGVLAAILAPVLAAMALPPVSPELQPPPACGALECALRSRGREGRLWLANAAPDVPHAERTMPAVWDVGEGAAPVTAEALRWLSRASAVVMTVELARTSITVQQWAHASVHDVLVFGGHPAPSNDPIPVTAHFGGMQAAAAVDRDGCLRLITPPHMHPVATVRKGATPMAADTESAPSERPTQDRAPAATQDGNEDPTDVSSLSVLGSLCLDVVAEVGRVSLRGDELAGLVQGAVVALGVTTPNLGVTLTSGGRPVAHGILVDVDGELGVRISERLG